MRVLEVRGAAERDGAGRRAHIFGDQKHAHHRQRGFARQHRSAHERDFFLHHADAAHRQAHRDLENRSGSSVLCLQVVDEPVPSFTLVLDVERFLRLERRIDHEAERAAGLQYRTVAGVLRQ